MRLRLAPQAKCLAQAYTFCDKCINKFNHSRCFGFVTLVTSLNMTSFTNVGYVILSEVEESIKIKPYKKTEI